MNAFDPLAVWLQIPAAEQPPSLYRLLSLRDFEANSELISEAAARTRQALATHEHGPYATQCRELISSVEYARQTLLTPAQKEAYDQQLLSQRGGQSNYEQPLAGPQAQPPGMPTAEMPLGGPGAAPASPLPPTTAPAAPHPTPTPAPAAALPAPAAQAQAPQAFGAGAVPQPPGNAAPHQPPQPASLPQQPSAPLAQQPAQQPLPPHSAPQQPLAQQPVVQQPVQQPLAQQPVPQSPAPVPIDQVPPQPAAQQPVVPQHHYGTLPVGNAAATPPTAQQTAAASTPENAASPEWAPQRRSGRVGKAVAGAVDNSDANANPLKTNQGKSFRKRQQRQSSTLAIWGVTLFVGFIFVVVIVALMVAL